MDNCRSPSRALRPMSLHFGAMSTDESVYISRREEERRLFNAKMEKRHRENALEREELDRSLDEQRERLDSIGTLLEHAMTFINEHPTPETSPWKKKEKPSTPERSSPTSEPVSPITVIKAPQASGFARKASLRRPLFPKPSNNNTTQQPNLPRPKPKLPPKPTHLTTMTPIFSSTPVETKIRQAPKVTDL